METQFSLLIGSRWITAELAPIKKNFFAPELTAAIEEKLKARQEIKRMRFLLT
jgi:hypothetical protein